MKKFLSFITTGVIFASSLCLLAGCDGTGGGGSDDETPHKLEVKAKVAGEETTGLDGLSGGGSYAVQDRVDLQAPKMAKYVFAGWYDQDGKFLGLPNEFNWNMAYEEDGYVEARYEWLKYDVEYVNDYVTTASSNPTSYDGSKDTNTTLTKPADVDGMTSIGWYYTKDGERIACDKLPDSVDEVAAVSYDQEKNIGIYKLILFADYKENEKEKYNVTLNLADGLSLAGPVKDADTGEEIDMTKPIAEGTKLDIWLDTSEIGMAYSFTGFYIDGEKIETQNRFTYTVTGNATIEAKIDIGYSITIFMEVSEGGGDYLGNGRKYRVVEETELPNDFKPLTYYGANVGATVNITFKAQQGVALANEIGDGEYELSTTDSQLSITIVDDDLNRLWIAYNLVETE